MKVELAEPLGTETILYISAGGQKVLGKIFDPREVAPGETMAFNLALDKLHLFDAGSGRTARSA